MEQLRGFATSMGNVSSPQTIMISDQCKKLVPTLSNKSAVINDQQLVLNSFKTLLSRHNLSINSLTSVPECIKILTRLMLHSNESNETISINPAIYSPRHSKSLIIFVVLIVFVSFVSVLGNLCLAKVLYTKRHRLIQTDRIVLCLALSELCLVLVDSPTEIYRFLSPSFTNGWLCQFHTFFEALFSSCIIFYHLLGAFDRFVYIHGHTSSQTSFWSRWSRRISTQTGSIILLIFPIICSLPLSIANTLHANVLHASPTNKICLVQYTHGILIGILTSFYLLPILFSFFLHAKLIYFIHRRHDQHYLTSTAYILPMKRNNTTEFQSKRHANKERTSPHDRSLLQPKNSSRRRLMKGNTEIIGPATTTTTIAKQSVPVNPNNSSNSSQSSRSSTGTGSTPTTTSSIVLYKINSQANANANRTVLLLVLLLSFYVCCWAPYNIYTWLHAYFLTQSSNRTMNTNQTSSSSNESNFKFFPSVTINLQADLRRIIYVNYSLYLLSMISMCFSFIFYFSLNKQARHEFSQFMGCICPSTNPIRKEQSRQKYHQQYQYRPHRYPNQYPYKNDRIKTHPPSVLEDRLQNANQFENGGSKRRVLNYGCQIQCCP